MKRAKDIQAEETRTLGSASSTPRTRSPSSRPLTPIGVPEPSLVSTPVVTKKPVLNVTPVTNPQTRIQIVDETNDVLKGEQLLCPFNTFGCTRTGGERSIKQHLCNEKEVHIAKLREAISPLKTGILSVVDGFEAPTRRLAALEHYMETVGHLYGASQLLWVITDYSKHLANAKTGKAFFVGSPTFQTHRHGYKLSVKWAPFGDEAHVREYCAAYVSIMAGDYDALLEWPFNLPIKLELLDQTQGLKCQNDDVVHAVVPKVIPENEPFLGKPTDKNLHFGIQKFVPVADMKEGGRYVNKDVAYLAVTVDVSAVKDPFCLAG